MPCPLCNDRGNTHAHRPSWLGSTNFANRHFDYLECSGCQSLYCAPMPDAETLSLMYGTSYGVAGGNHQINDPRDFERIVSWLRKQTPGMFFDFGCGAGETLRAALSIGWKAMGLEYDPAVAARTSAATGARVLSALDASTVGVADVLNVGDVIEHLTDPLTQMREVLRTLKPGGILLAQGPLEANRNLLTLALRVGGKLRPRASTMPPYHVTLATARGQREFFTQLGLQELEFDVTEVDWPAPSRISPRDLRNPRTTALFALRRVSTAVKSLGVPDWGNRYFFAGRRAVAAA